ncbi:UNVERIFIED_CONTAM: hypothetical protein RMT77_010763 [Armadillidium vulgare]
MRHIVLHISTVQGSALPYYSFLLLNKQYSMITLKMKVLKKINRPNLHHHIVRLSMQALFLGLVIIFKTKMWKIYIRFNKGELETKLDNSSIYSVHKLCLVLSVTCGLLTKDQGLI